MIPLPSADAKSVPVQTAVAAAASKGVLFVSSAGNDHSDNNITPHWPSNIGTDTTLSVAALGRNGAIWCAAGCFHRCFRLRTFKAGKAPTLTDAMPHLPVSAASSTTSLLSH